MPYGDWNTFRHNSGKRKPHSRRKENALCIMPIDATFKFIETCFNLHVMGHVLLVVKAIASA